MDVESDYSLAKNRSKREKSDKNGKFAALAKLREAKLTGEKFKPDILREKNVYEEVDEMEYSEIVKDRQKDDWIVDDGSGYVEDGREMFDEDIYDEPEYKKSKTLKKDLPGSTGRNPNIRPPHSKPSNIKSMFAAAAIKPKKKIETNTDLEKDDLLMGLMEEMKKEDEDIILPTPVRWKKNRKSSNDNKERTVTKDISHIQKVQNVAEPEPQPIKSLASNNSANINTFINILNNSTPPVITPQQQQLPQQEMTPIEDEDDDDEELIPAMCWLDAFEGSSDLTCIQNESVESSQISVLSQQQELVYGEDEDGEKMLKMYWLDAFEDHIKQPGVVYLFGKVWVESSKTHQSCCLIVRNIERRIFILPRSHRLLNGKPSEESVSMADVYQEFNTSVSAKYNIMSFKSKKSTKLYAFEKDDIPMESEYLEVRYPATQPQIPADTQGDTFSHIFGTTTSSLEVFLIDRKIKGPCWLDVRKTQRNNPPVSWCSFELSISRLEDVSVVCDQPSPPSLCAMSLNLVTYNNPVTKENEILGVSMLVNPKLPIDKVAPKVALQPYFCAICKPHNCVFPFDFKEKLEKKMNKIKIEVAVSERALLGLLTAKICKLDPDVIVGHDLAGFELDLLLHRMQTCRVPHWSKVGRLKRNQFVRFGSKGASNHRTVQLSCTGRLLCDVQTSARELIRCRSYDLTELVSHVLKGKRKVIDEITDVVNLFNSSDRLIELISCNMSDSSYVFMIMCELNIIPLALQITNICGNLMARTLMGGRSERNEYLLLHAFSNKGFIVPDKIYGNKNKQVEEDDGDDEDGKNHKTRRKPAYTGGLVLEPKKGFYDHFILLLDFNSLYPSIIQEYNICFTTVVFNNPPAKNSTTNAMDDMKYDETLIPDSSLPPGVLPTEIRKLVESRRQVRGLMKNCDEKSDLYQQYDIRQKALKLTANSMYGCLGFSSSRFYAKRLAALITGKGREILLKTKDLVQGMSIEVIYGDTDSIMVNTGLTSYDDVIKLGNKIKSEVNKLYRLLEIDIDGVFKSMLLLKKKKYAAVMVTKMADGSLVTKQESKGLDIVRRDWCPLAKEVGNYMLSQVFSGECREVVVENIHNKLFQVAQQVREGQVAKEMFYITKQLTRNPEDYKNRDGLIHVQVAARLNTQVGRRLKAGDIVYYVICQNGTNDPATKRAYHPDELNKSDHLQIDTNYYLSQQVHPVVTRLCDPIEGTDAGHIAECLGLDAKSYRPTVLRRDGGGDGDDDDDDALTSRFISDEEKYRDCLRFSVVCPSCGHLNVIEGAYVVVVQQQDTTAHCRLALQECNGTNCSECLLLHPAYLKNKLMSFMRGCIRRYYDGWMVCEDVCCNHRTRKVPLAFKNGHSLCPECGKNALRLEYTEKCLYNQLSYLQTIFDVNYFGTIKDKSGLKPLKPHELDLMDGLKEVVDQKMRRSAYAEVDLSKLFNTLFNK